jgi:hypothetical protein
MPAFVPRLRLPQRLRLAWSGDHAVAGALLAAIAIAVAAGIADPLDGPAAAAPACLAPRV